MNLNLKRHAVTGVTLILLLISMSMFVQILKDDDRTTGLARDNVVFVTGKLDYELAQFINGLTQFGSKESGASVDVEELHLRFDVFWSRLLLVNEGETGRRIRADAQNQAAVDAAWEIIRQEEDTVMSLSPGDEQARKRLIQKFGALATSLHQINVRVMQDEQLRYTEVTSRHEATRKMVNGVIGATILCALLLFAMVVTENRRAGQFARQNLQLMAAAEHSGHGVFVCRRGTGRQVIEYCNDRFADYVGQRPELLKGKNLKDVIDPLLAQSGNPLDYEAGVDQEVELLVGQGPDRSVSTQRQVHFEYIALVPSDNPEGHRFGLVRDISEQKKNERELIEAKELAEAGSRAKSDFLAIMSHEIRTPMNGVLGTIELLQNEATHQRQRHFLEVAQNSGRDLVQIVDDILDFSKFEAGQTDSEATNFNLNQQIIAVHRLFDPIAVDKGITLSCSVDTNAHTELFGQPTPIRRIIGNLVSNAVKFTNKGNIHVHAETSAIDDNSDTVMLTVTVEDTGTGIPDGQIDRVFDPFYQARDDEGQRTSRSGTGLGLAICERLVSSMNGTIEVESVVNRGSIFRACLPMEIQKAQSADHTTGADYSDATVPIPANSFVGISVLIAEDSYANQLVATHMLKYYGVDVTIASDGREAVKAVHENAFDMVFMDIRMPRLDGIMATQAIRQLECDWRDLPVVALTADAVGSEKTMCLNAGMNDYLAKPYSRDQLIQMVQRWTENQSATATTPHRQPAFTLSDSSVASQPTAHQDHWSREPRSDVSEFDQQILEQLARDTSSEMVPEMIDAFVGEADLRIEHIMKLIDTDGEDTPDIRRQIFTHAHTLKSEAGTFGANRLRDIATQLEGACQNESTTPNIHNLAIQTADIFRDVRTEAKTRNWTTV